MNCTMSSLVTLAPGFCTTYARGRSSWLLDDVSRRTFPRFIGYAWQKRKFGVLTTALRSQLHQRWLDDPVKQPPTQQEQLGSP